MKKLISVLLIALAIFIPSCKSASMQDILSYESKSYTAEFSVSSGDDTTLVSLIKDGETYTFVVDGKYTFLYSDDKWSISYDGLTVPLSGNAAKRSVPSKLMEALSQNAYNGWSISEESAGGTALYICECESTGVVLYIDAATRLPLKITWDDVECNVIRFEISNRQ